MKRAIFVLSVLVCSITMMAEPVLRHIDTNGPKGASLFKEDANGFAEYKAVVPFQINFEEALANVEAWAKSLGMGVAVKNLKTEDKTVSFQGKVNVNEDLTLFRIMVGDSARYYAKAESQLYFDCIIEIREGRLRILFNNILSERESISGDYIESEGPVNDIYWNRINGIKQQQAKAKNKKAKKYAKAIDFENKLYSIEYQVIADIAQSLRTSMISYTEEEW